MDDLQTALAEGRRHIDELAPGQRRAARYSMGRPVNGSAAPTNPLAAVRELLKKYNGDPSKRADVQEAETVVRIAMAMGCSLDDAVAKYLSFSAAERDQMHLVDRLPADLAPAQPQQETDNVEMRIDRPMRREELQQYLAERGHGRVIRGAVRSRAEMENRLADCQRYGKSWQELRDGPVRYGNDVTELPDDWTHHESGEAYANSYAAQRQEMLDQRRQREEQTEAIRRLSASSGCPVGMVSKAMARYQRGECRSLERGLEMEQQHTRNLREFGVGADAG